MLLLSRHKYEKNPISPIAYLAIRLASPTISGQEPDGPAPAAFFHHRVGAQWQYAAQPDAEPTHPVVSTFGAVFSGQQHHQVQAVQLAAVA